VKAALACCSAWTAGRADAQADVLSHGPPHTDVMGIRAEDVDCCLLRTRRSALPLHGRTPRKGCASRSITRLLYRKLRSIICNHSVIVVLLIRGSSV